MLKIKVKGQTVQTGELGHTHGQKERRTDSTKYIISLASLSIEIFMDSVNEVLFA